MTHYVDLDASQRMPAIYAGTAQIAYSDQVRQFGHEGAQSGGSRPQSAAASESKSQPPINGRGLTIIQPLGSSGKTRFGVLRWLELPPARPGDP